MVPVFFAEFEHAPHGDFFQILANSKHADERFARLYFQQLLDGLNWCHTCKVVHRNLTPESLLLDQSFDLKIAGFGLACHYV